MLGGRPRENTTPTLKGLAAATLIALAPAAVATPFFAAPEVYVAPFSKVAVGGYDAVSYFTGAPLKGDTKFTTTWKGAEFGFARAASRIGGRRAAAKNFTIDVTGLSGEVRRGHRKVRPEV